MDDLISRQAAKEHLQNCVENRKAIVESSKAEKEHEYHLGQMNAYVNAVRIIDRLPTIEPKKGKEEWLESLILDNELLGDWFCDEMATSEWCEENCRFTFPHRECLEKAFELGVFNCGARMDG